MLYCTQYQSNTKLGEAEIFSSLQAGFSDKHKLLDSWTEVLLFYARSQYRVNRSTFLFVHCVLNTEENYAFKICYFLILSPSEKILFRASPGVDFKATVIVTKVLPLLPVIFYNIIFWIS